MNRKNYSRLLESVQEADEVARGKRTPSRQFHVDSANVLHCFQKKTQKTSRHDLELATERFKRLPPKNANEK